MHRKPALLGGEVVLKNCGISLAKAIDTLLHITDDEPIALGLFAAKRAKDEILGGVYVLVLIDEQSVKSGLPMARQCRGLFLARIPEQLKGELLQIMKIKHTALAFFPRESLRKFTR